MPFIPLLILLITLIWGYTWVLMKVALDYMGPFSFSFFRFLVGTITMFLIVFVMRLKRPAREDWPHLVLLGLLQTTFVFAFVMYGMRFVEAGKSSILLYSMPIWSMILSRFFLGEQVTVRKLTSIIAGMLGLLFILGWDLWFQQNVRVVVGEFMIVVGAVSWGAANVILKKRFRDHNKIQVSAWQMLFGTLGLFMGLLMGEWGAPVEWTGMSILAVLFSGVLASAFCFTAWFIVVSKIDTTVASVSLMFVPVMALFFGWLQLEETIDAGVMTGTLLISLGIYLATVPERRSQQRNIDS